jgi:hypothetical protein
MLKRYRLAKGGRPMEVASGHLEYEQADADALSTVSTRPLTGLWHEAAHLPIEQMAKSEARNQLEDR